MVRDEIEFYGPVELRELEEPFDAVCRGIIEGADRDAMILDLRRREFTPQQADRFIARAEETLCRLGGTAEEYAAVQRKQTTRLLIGVSVLIGGLALLPMGIFAYGGLGVGIVLVSAAGAMKVRYSDLRKRLMPFLAADQQSAFEPVYRKLAQEADEAEVRVGSVTFTSRGIYRLTRGLKDTLIPREEIRRVQLLSGPQARHPLVLFLAGALLLAGGLGAGVWTVKGYEVDGVIHGSRVATAVIALIVGLPLIVAGARRAPNLVVTTDTRIYRLVIEDLDEAQDAAAAVKAAEERLGYSIQPG